YKCSDIFFIFSFICNIFCTHILSPPHVISLILCSLTNKLLCFPFRPIESKNDGILGYVSHSYKKDNLYQSIGNFFIGIAPIIGGT
ncbi:hypothetical protein ACTPEF_24675, partial [Clostridioides difficile]